MEGTNNNFNLSFASQLLLLFQDGTKYIESYLEQTITEVEFVNLDETFKEIAMKLFNLY
jgi:hypothetical protein